MSTIHEASSTRRAIDGAVLGTYVAIVVALTWPLLPNITTAVPSDLGDPLLNAWILWWNAVTVPLTERWWNAPAFYPATGVLAFSEHLLGLTPLSSPIYWISGNIQLAYNVVFLASFVLSAFFTYLLCLDLTGRRDAALIGGLIFGFSPYRIAHLSHLQVLCSFWMPVALLGLHRYVREPRRIWLALFAGGWLLQALSNGYFMAFLPVLFICWVAWFVRRDWPRLKAIAVAGAITSLPLVPIVLGYRAVQQPLGLTRSGDEILAYSADLSSLFDTSRLLAAWPFEPPFHRAEGELFPGLTGILLVIAGLALAERQTTTRTSDGLRRLCAIFLALTVLFVASAFNARFAPWTVEVAGLTISMTRAYKPLALGLVCAIGWLLTSAPVRAAMRERSPLAFYVLTAGLFWMLCWGPRPTWLGDLALDRGPYGWLARLPGFDTFRTPARFFSVALVSLACAAALGFARLARRVPALAQRVLTVAATLLALADTWVTSFPLASAPPRLGIPAQMAAAPFVLVPLGDVATDVSTMYRSIATGAVPVNGYSGYRPPWYGALQHGLRAHDAGLLHELARHGVRHLVVDTSLDGGSDWQRVLDARSDVTRLADDAGHRLYVLPPAAAAPPRAYGAPVSIAHLAVSLNAPRLMYIVDGDLQTRWDTGRPKQGDEVVTLDLGQPRELAALVLSLGPSTSDGPAELAVDIGDDGQGWTEIWRGTTAAEWFRAGLRDPRRVPVTLDLGRHTTRYLRLRQIGTDPVMWWSIAEATVLAPPGT